jgi:hypothetical protein
VRDHTKFGYTYTDVQGKDQAAVRSQVNTLYGPSNSFTSKRKRDAIDTSAKNSTAQPSPQGGPSDRLYHLNVRGPKNGLSSSYYVDFFLDGPKSEDPATWTSDSNFLATHAIIAMKMPDSAYGVTVGGVVPLNSRLEELVTQGRLTDMSVDSVMALLKGHLQWKVRLVSFIPDLITTHPLLSRLSITIHRVRSLLTHTLQVDGSDFPIEKMPTLRISVATVEYEMPEREDEFPTYVGDWDVHFDVTEGKLGGLNPTEAY